MSPGLTCPKCQRRMTMNFKTNQVSCPHCGYVRPDEIGQMDAAAETIKAQQGRRKSVPITHKGPIEQSARGAFETGCDWLSRGNRHEALRAFRRAADYQPDFVDAHLWAAKAADDDQTRRAYLENALALNPNHLEATRMLMVLNGQLTPEEAARPTSDTGPRVKKVEEAVRAKAADLICPTCGGHLTVNEQAGRVECRSCGYSAPQQVQSYNENVLSMALLKRQAQPVIWNVGNRLVQCQQCGAEHTIPAGKLSARCRFCGSTQVVLGDTLSSFEQPDSLIPFTVSEIDAVERIEKELDSLKQRLGHLLGAGQARQSAVEGVYLPFWIFNATVEITRTRTTYLTLGDTSEDRTSMIDAVNNIPICAVKSPPPALLRQMADYQLSAVVPYEPKWLAKYPAQLYSVDFDRASLEAREIAHKTMSRKYKRVVENKHINERGRQQTEVTRTISQVQGLAFYLILLPVWITVTVEAKKIQIALVNGQTGKTVLGTL